MEKSRENKQQERREGPIHFTGHAVCVRSDRATLENSKIL